MLKMDFTPSFHHFKSTSSRGIALISTLAIVAIVTVLLVSFVSVVNQDRGATQNYGQAIRADEIARGGLDTLVGLLRQETTDPTLNDYTNTASGTNAMYFSSQATNMFPQKWAGPAFPTIVSYSGTNLYSGATIAATNSLTDTNSLNGRSFGISRWDKAQLVTAETFPNPSWILVTRNGTNAIPGLADAANSSLGNQAFVVGRYAYVIYDTSGLIDINVAGNPLSGSVGTYIPKGLLPWADLTALTNGTKAIDPADVTKLIAWRNAATSGNSLTNFSGTNAWATNGFMKVVNGDSAFLGRQDLINYITNQAPSLSNSLPYLTTFTREANGPTWGPNTNMLGIYFQYQQNRTNTQATNALAYKAVVTRNGGARQFYPSIAFQSGEPVLKYRFPLNRLSILEHQNAGQPYLSASDINLVNAYFGMDPVTDVTRGPSKGLFRHWVYPTANPAYVHNTAVLDTNSAAATPDPTIFGHIYTLDEVAALNPPREPDFFELLKAGILSGSLGIVGRGDDIGRATYGRIQFMDPDAMTDGQIIQIGANIMDQWDADDYPTTITWPQNGIDYYGVENLPYLEQIYATYTQRGKNPMTAQEVPIISMCFQLWNPHQQPVTASTSPVAQLKVGVLQANGGNSVGNTAGTFSVEYGAPTAPPKHNLPNIYNPWAAGTVGYWGFNPNSVQTNGGILFQNSETYRTPTILTGTATNDDTSYAQAQWGKFLNSSAAVVLTGSPLLMKYDFTAPANASGSPIGWEVSTTNSSAPGTNSIHTWGKAPDVQQTWDTIPGSTNNPPANWNVYLSLATVTFATLFLDPNDGTTYHPYGTFAGVVSNGYATWGSTYPQPGGYPNFYSGEDYPYLELTNASTIWANRSLVKPDPRTRRWGPLWAYTPATGASAIPTPSLNLYKETNSPNSHTPSYQPAMPTFGAPEGSPYDFTQFMINTGNIGYTDPDGARRSADYKTAGNPYTTAGSRPQVLNRPFNSVGELGFVYRDVPWKNLDFSSPQSADAGLLDLFTVEESPVIAGRVNPNTPYPQVIAAMLSGAPLTSTTTGTTTMNASVAAEIAGQIFNAASNAPLVNRADIVARLMTNSTISTPIGTGSKTEREAVARALAEAANTRTWNFMIDLVAQSGRYPAAAKTYNDFVVTGERRYWLHVAIDRYTGQVVDQQLEKVGE
jgi:hypothetical protein